MEQNLKFFVFNARDTRPFAQSIVQKAYDMWRGVWLAALSELDGASDMKSDDFSRQELIGALFQDDVCVGSVSFSEVDLSQSMWRKDSYFSAWPESTMIGLGERYPSILVCSYFTLSQSYRRGSHGFNGKQLLSALAVEHFFNSRKPAMVGTMRVNRGMHTLCYDLHATPIETGLQMHGVEVDLILFDQERLQGDSTLRGPMAEEAARIYARSLQEWNDATRFAVVKKSA